MEKELSSLINELGIKDDWNALLDNAIGTLMLDPIAIKNFILQIANMPVMIRDGFYLNKFYMFVTGINKIQNDLGGSIRLSNKLFGDDKSKEQNGMRLLGYIDKADSKQKVDYYVNATRSLLMGLVDTTDYFRIMKALSETLNEDLEYLAGIAEHESLIRGNIHLLSLELSGLVIQASIDANESIETQNYTVSSLGKMVDQYAISLEDDNRQSYYKNAVAQNKLEVNLPTINIDNIEEIFNGE